MMADADPQPPRVKAPVSPAFQVGEWLAEPAWNRISRNGEARKLEPRVMRLLTVLAASPRQPLGRGYLIEAVWPDLHVNEEALSRAISLLRRAFSDESRAPRYIATVHKGGYSLIATVEPSAPDGPAPGSSRRGLWRIGAGLALAIVLALLSYRVLVSNQSSGPAEGVLTPVPLTSEVGREIDPAISRDGGSLAFGASTPAGYDLFWRSIPDGQAVRLTFDGRFSGYPSWSPAGDRIVFVRGDDRGSSIDMLTLAGGRAESLVRLTSWSAGLDWSPDGRTIAFSDGTPDGGRAIVLLDLATGARRLVSRESLSAADSRPAFSPDGRQLAFLRNAGMGLQRLLVSDVARPEQVGMIIDEPREIAGFDWNPTGTGVIFAARTGDRYALWEVSRRGGPAKPIRSEGGDLFNPSISAGGRIVAEAVSQDSDIWRGRVDGTGSAPLLRSTFEDSGAVPSPDQSQIAFISSRSGSPQIWLADGDGGNAAQLTHLTGLRPGGLVWSPDGSRIAFHARGRGYAATYGLDLAHRTTRRLPGEPGAHRIPLGWSRAGDLLTATGTGLYWTAWRQDHRSGDLQPLNSVPARLASLAVDGRSVWLVGDGARLLQVALESGRIRKLALPAGLADAAGIQAIGDHLYFFVPGSEGLSVFRVDPDAPDQFRRVGSVPTYALPSIAPDERHVYFTQNRESANDLVLLSLH